MQTFISKTLDDILLHTHSFKNVVFVLPSQRAGIFVKQAIKNKISNGFLPEIINIETFIGNVSKIEKIDSIQLLFYFYTIYKKFESNPDTFDVFSSWAITVLQDFNELDQHLVNTKDIFVYIRDIERLRKWSVKGTFKETDLIKSHYSFLEKMNEYYTAFYQFLTQKNIGYQGLMYREATKKIGTYLTENQQQHFFFIGFNALNKAEELLFQEVLSTGNSEIYWDIDVAFLQTKHQAGTFIRKYLKEWHYYEKNKLKTVGNWFSQEKNIQIIGVSKNSAQIKYAGEIIKKIPNYNKTVLVLADETLLPVTLNSLPKNIEAINITMGYPLKNIPITSLFFSIFKLFLTQEKLQKTPENLFYYKDVVQFLKEPIIYHIISKNNSLFFDTITKKILVENNIFISQKIINLFIKNTEENEKKVVLAIFNPYTNISDFFERISNLISLLKNDVNELEKEYLFRFYTIFTQLQNLQNKFHYFQDLKTVYQFFKQLINLETLSFHGEPLQGLQLMGMLETRVLDFENVIITSVNEGILPKKSRQNSFIPFDVKVQFGLPTYKEKDAIFSYHFFRLIQRAKNIYFLYNTEHDVFGNGEKSRFIAQLELIKKKIWYTTISPKVLTEKPFLIEITKNKAILEKLKELAKEGISPTTLTNFLYNPVAFYKQKVLKVNMFKNLEETIAANTMGTVIHDTLEELYKPFEEKFIIKNNISKMQKQSKKIVIKYFAKHFKNGTISTGKNRLIFEVANRFVYNFLAQEKKLLSNEDNRLKIIATEQKLATTITVEGLDFPIKIKGTVDRIDELNGVTRIIDYKTGIVSDTDLKIIDFGILRELKYHKAIQVLLYAFLYTKNDKLGFNKPLQAGVYSFKNLKNGFLKVNFSSNNKISDNQITEEKLAKFMVIVKEVITEMYNIKVPFVEPANLPF